tara:strand:- start:116 stop:331 length:216 start_codon:yes stop_codon:yes gene_type:complete
MNSQEFYLWLNGYLEALESEGIEVCKIKNIREKMNEVNHRPNQERVVFGPNVQQQGYVNKQTHTPPSNKGV